MNRERIARIGLAAVAAAGCSVSATAKDAPTPNLTIVPITAPNLLAPIEESGSQSVGYRLNPGLGPVSGQRARLSVDLGDSTLFAITGRLAPRPGPPGPLEPGQAKALGIGHKQGGKVYGGGVSRTFGGVDVSATYQYSKISAEQAATDSEAKDVGMGRSHSVRATARIRFRP